MLINLVKKDVLIAKKLVLATMLIMLVLPLLIVRLAPSLSGFFIFLYMVVLADLMLSQAVSYEEDKYPKAVALLCAAPYTRSAFVKAKYVFHLLVFAYCFVVYSFITLITDKTNALDLTSTLAVLLFSVILNGIYVPIVFKYGAIKARFFFIVMVIVFSAGPAIFSTFFASIDLAVLTNAISSIPNVILCICLALLSIVIFIISLAISIQVFSKKEI